MLNRIALFITELLHHLGQWFGVKRLQKETIITLTRIAQNGLKHYFGQSRIDQKAKEHILFVTNRIIYDMRDLELTRAELRSAMDNAVRLYHVLNEYKDKTTANEEKILSIIDDFSDKFKGG